MNRGKCLRISLIAMAAVLVLTVVPTRAAADYSASWAGDKMNALEAKGVYAGLETGESGMLEPDKAVTRAEFLLILFNAMGLDLAARDTSRTAPFADYQDAPDTYKAYLAEGYHRGVLLGVNRDEALYSNWNTELTRQEAITIIGRVLNAQSDEPLDFTDADIIAVWAYTYLSALTEKGIISGMPDGSFSPFSSMTIAEISHIVHLLIEKKLFVPQEIRVYAGSTDLGMNDGARLTASFGIPYGLTVGTGGVLLTADREANLLRRISAESVSTIAGQKTNVNINGLPERGYKDNISTEELMMRGPRYLYQASDGTIYYSDGGNHVVRMIMADGKGYTLSGIGKSGYTNGARDKTQFNLPSGLAVGADGTIYVADTLNNCIRTITKKGESALYAGNPDATGGYKDGTLTEAMFCEPTDIHFGPDGALYIADTGNSMIRVIRGGQVTTLAGCATGREELTGAMLGGYRDGAAAQALFRGPLGIYVDNNDVVYVADSENNVIRKIEDGYVTTIAGNLKPGNSTGPALVSMLNNPIDVAVLNGRVYVSDGNNHCIKVFGTGLVD